MSSQRSLRVAEEIKKELSQIIQSEMKDPRLGFLSVTDVEISQDLRYVKAFVSILGSDKEREVTLGVLQRASGFLRTELASPDLRHTPELSFHLTPPLNREPRSKNCCGSWSQKVTKVCEQIRELLASSERIILLSHHNPDGDAQAHAGPLVTFPGRKAHGLQRSCAGAVQVSPWLGRGVTNEEALAKRKPTIWLWLLMPAIWAGSAQVAGS